MILLKDKEMKNFLGEPMPSAKPEEWFCGYRRKIYIARRLSKTISLWKVAGDNCIDRTRRGLQSAYLLGRRIKTEPPVPKQQWKILLRLDELFLYQSNELMVLGESNLGLKRDRAPGYERHMNARQDRH